MRALFLSLVTSNMLTLIMPTALNLAKTYERNQTIDTGFDDIAIKRFNL